MKLSEVATYNPDTVLGTEVRIRNWLDTNHIRDYNILDNLVVDVKGSVDLESTDRTILPVQFGYVDGNFDCYGSALKSLRGFPNRIGGNLYLYDSHIYSLHGIEKIITHIGGGIVINPTVTHLLGLLLIELGEFSIDDNGPLDEIMNKYKNTGDILAAQDELLDAGFKAQARL